MTSGFYEQLNIDARASAGQIREAYSQAVARLVTRRRAVAEQGGETGPLDLAREQLDEAWNVLSDPIRRRRYDAMLAWVDSARAATDEALWDEVSDSLVHPAAAIAAKLLRVTTRLTDIGELPLAPSADAHPPTLVPADEDRTAPVAHIGPTEAAETAPTETGAPVVSLPTAPPVSVVQERSLRVVDGTPAASPVVVLPTEPASPGKTVSAEDIARLSDQHGPTGALLRAVREAREIPLQDMADTTRISVTYLESIEEDRFENLPSATFVRGYVREMCRMLKLDEKVVVPGYMQRFSG